MRLEAGGEGRKRPEAGGQGLNMENDLSAGHECIFRLSARDEYGSNVLSIEAMSRQGQNVYKKYRIK